MNPNNSSTFGSIYVFLPDLLTLLFVIFFLVISRCFLKPNPNR